MSENQVCPFCGRWWEDIEFMECPCGASWAEDEDELIEASHNTQEADK